MERFNEVYYVCPHCNCDFDILETLSFNVLNFIKIEPLDVHLETFRFRHQDSLLDKNSYAFRYVMNMEFKKECAYINLPFHLRQEGILWYVNFIGTIHCPNDFCHKKVTTFSHNVVHHNSFINAYKRWCNFHTVLSAWELI